MSDYGGIGGDVDRKVNQTKSGKSGGPPIGAIIAGVIVAFMIGGFIMMGTGSNNRVNYSRNNNRNY